MLVFVVATTAVSTQLSVVPPLIIMSNPGWVGAISAVIMPQLYTPPGVFWMMQYLRSTAPCGLIEAAQVGGCSMLRTFEIVAVSAARPAAAMLPLRLRDDADELLLVLVVGVLEGAVKGDQAV